MVDIRTKIVRLSASFHSAEEFATGKLGDRTIVAEGKNIRIQDAHGPSYIDGFVGLYWANIGQILDTGGPKWLRQ